MTEQVVAKVPKSGCFRPAEVSLPGRLFDASNAEAAIEAGEGGVLSKASACDQCAQPFVIVECHLICSFHEVSLQNTGSIFKLDESTQRHRGMIFYELQLAVVDSIEISLS